MIDGVDWDCEVLKNYADKNLGCIKRVSSGLDWAFSQVESAILLEDDCLPHPSFFNFCETLLYHYWDDERVWVISGNNFQDGQCRGDGSYYFSHYNHCWGWASWQRAWKHYDHNLEQWESLKKSGLLNSIFDNSYERQYWYRIWERLYYEKEPDSWNYCWFFTCVINSGLSVLPNVNLVSNIGFGPNGTHTVTEKKLSNMAVSEIAEIKYTSFILRNKTADLYTFKHKLGGDK